MVQRRRVMELEEGLEQGTTSPGRQLLSEPFLSHLSSLGPLASLRAARMSPSRPQGHGIGCGAVALAMEADVGNPQVPEPAQWRLHGSNVVSCVRP